MPVLTDNESFTLLILKVRSISANNKQYLATQKQQLIYGLIKPNKQHKNIQGRLIIVQDMAS